MMRRVVLMALALVIGLLVAHPSAALAVTRWVNDDDPNGGAYVPPGTNCNNPGYATIQAAVTAAVANDTINVCPGTYPEQVTIPAGKNNLRLRSVTPLAAVIMAPAVMVDPGDIVRVDASRNVTIRDFKITGPLPDALFCSPFPRTGVRVDGGGSAIILGNHITEIRSTSPAFRGCQNGVAIQVGRMVEGEAGEAAITANRIDLYQKNGMTIDNAGSRAAIAGNTVTGIGPTPVNAQNGIQVSRGAVAVVAGNGVTDNTYSLAPTFGSTGILLFSAATGTTVQRNLLLRNDDNIGVYTTSGARILDNTARDSTFFDGIFMNEDTSNNRVSGNFLRNNSEHDCHDDSDGGGTAGTANFWTNNDGLTDQPDGLCRSGEGPNEN